MDKVPVPGGGTAWRIGFGFVEGERRNNPAGDETIFCLRRRTAETSDGYQTGNDNGAMPGDWCGDGQMRAFSVILACGLMLAGTTMAGLADGGLPGIGTFHYSGPPLAGPPSLVVAAR